MSKIEFTQKEKEIISKKIQMYFREELDQKIGLFDAQFLLDFISEEIAPLYYNKGLYDAQAVLQSQLENIADKLYEIEKPTEFGR